MAHLESNWGIYCL